MSRCSPCRTMPVRPHLIFLLDEQVRFSQDSASLNASESGVREETLSSVASSSFSEPQLRQVNLPGERKKLWLHCSTSNRQLCNFSLRSCSPALRFRQ